MAAILGMRELNCLFTENKRVIDDAMLGLDASIYEIPYNRMPISPKMYITPTL